MIQTRNTSQKQKLSPPARHQQRQEKALPILMQFKAWLDEASYKVTHGELY